MARIPDELIARLKREVDLARVVEASGVALERRGKDWVGLCPLHPDKTPSLFVNSDKGSWHCFGCDQGGSVIDWRMATARLSFREAVESLMAEHLAGSGADVEALDPAVPRLTDVELDELIGLSDAELRRWVAQLYHGKAKDDPKPKEYLASRGLTHPDLIDAFQLGYADRTLGLMLPAKAWKRGAAIRERLTALGILRESGHEHLAGRLVVPLVSLEGEVLQLYGRAVTPNLRTGTPDHLYLPGSCDGLLNPLAFRDSDELILCEAPLDALTFWCAGFRNVTTSFGTNGFTPALHEALRLHGTRRLLIAYDRDDAGDAAARSLADRLLAEGIECYRVLFPRGMDANEYAQKVQPAERSLDLVLRHAEWMGEGPSPSVLVPELMAAAGGVAGDLSSLPSPDSSPEAASSLAASPSPASLLPSRPRVEVPAEVHGHEVVITLGDRRYRVRGLDKNLSYDVLRINLLASRGEGFHVDTLDLCSARQRAAFLKQAATELAIEPELAKKDLGKVLLKLEELQDEQIQTALAPKEPVVRISEPAREAAEAHLSRPGLVARTVADLERAGLVGEETNKLVVYFAAVSRKLADPLAVLIQSSSAAGKSALLSSTLALMPEEEVIAYSAMTGQSLFYMGGKDLQHKILSIAEEEGAERASYALKLLQSEGRLSIASTGKDPTTGRLLTHEYHVEGPAAILTTTTAIDLDEEFQNRCIVLTVDESREQTEAIHRFQRQLRTLEGLAAQEQRKEVLELHRNAQRLLEPLRVVNPYALSLSYPSTCTRTRRDHMKYLGLIEAIALLHQRQREVKTLHRGGKEVRYVEATLDDVELANRLAHEVLGRSLDELPPQTQGLLEQIHRMVEASCRRLAVDRRDHRFSRREIREETGWGNTQLKMHLHRLEELEYLIVHHGRRGQSFVYELLYDGEAEQRERFLMGLLDVEGLRISLSDSKKSGSTVEKSGPSRAQVGVKSGGGRSPRVLVPLASVPENDVLAPPRALRGQQNGAASHAKIRRSETPGPALVAVAEEESA